MPDNISPTYIANLALAEISAHAITDLSDDTQEARWCNRFYEQCRDEMLRTHPWNFAMKRVDLSLLVGTPVNEWAYAYGLPSDYITLYSLNAFVTWNYTYGPGETRLFQIEDGNLLTDASVATIRYVFQQTDTTRYDPLFVTALSVLLASKISKPITGNDGTNILQKYEAISLPRAMKMDAREGKPHVISPIDQSAVVNARYTGDIYRY